MSAVALISELMMRSQVGSAATRAGVTLEIVSSDDALVNKVDAAAAGLIVLDLSHPGLDPAQLVPRLKEIMSPTATIVAFGPHVHVEQLKAAVAAGCDVVISRGQFHAQMGEILARYGH